MSINMEGRHGIDLETAELLARKSETTQREVEFRRKLGIVFGDQIILSIVMDMAYGNIPGKGGYLWKIAEPIIEEYKDVIDMLNPNQRSPYAPKSPVEQETAYKLAEGPTPPAG
jgi:hypothetical protein